MAVSSGGAVFAAGNSNVNFTSSTANFTRNMAIGGGAVFAYSASNINFMNAAVNFASNTAVGGGAISASNNSNINFAGSTVNFTSNTAVGGGAVFAYNSNINFASSTINFTSNTAVGGGAIFAYGASNINFTSVTVNFINNMTAGYEGGEIPIEVEGSVGGAVCAAAGSNVNFIYAIVNFAGNTANSSATVVDGMGSSGGAVYAYDGSNVNFTSSTVNFVNNMAVNSGGAISANISSEVNFTSATVNFTNNEAGLGGAVYAANGSNINFTSSTVNFTSNTANNGGGAIYFDAAASFIESDIVFRGNRSEINGGAIYLNENGSIDFGSSDITAEENVAVSSGGFLYSTGNRNIDINLDKIHLASNTAAAGGTFYGQSGTTFTFTAANSNITNSSASRAGGYIALGENGTGDFRSTVLTASGNSAQKGGFMYLAGANALFDKAEFENNQAQKGGAIALLNGATIEFSGSEGIFRNNTATEYGGAIYANGENGNNKKAVMSVLSGNVIFEGNIANGEANDIYLGEHTNFELIIDSISVVSMDGGIKGIENSIFTKTGLGKLELSNNSINKYYGNFKIEQGTVEAASAEITFGKLDIEANGIYSLINGNASQSTYTGETNIKGTLEIDADLDTYRADMLKAALNSANVDLKSTSKLKLNIYGANRNIGENVITIIETQGKVNGKFSNDPFAELGYVREIGGKNPDLVYYDDRVDIVMIRGSNFEKEFGNLTHNQTEIARSADTITAGMGQRAGLSGEFLEVMNKIERLERLEEKKRALDELAGSEIANILSAGAYGYGHEEIFERLQPRMNEDNKILKSMWGQAYSYGRDNDSDENSVKEFKISGYGIGAGADLVVLENKIAGVYGSYEKSAAKQGKSKADIEALGIGLYGGWFGEDVDVKARVYGGKLQYKIDRVLELLEERAQGETEGYNVKMDLLGQYNIWVNDEISISPYGHIKGGYVKNSAMKDKGRGGANMEVYDDSYARLETRFGVGINYAAIENLVVYAKVSGGYLAAGERAEYKGEFIDTGEEMNIWGAQGGKASFGAGIGAEYEITEKWSVYANISGNYFDSGKEYYGNAGVNYSFMTGKKEKAAEEKEPKEIREKPMTKKYKLNVANFSPNEYLLTEESKEIIAREANEIKKYSYDLITVAGHADSSEDDDVEMLSRKRAESVYKEFLLNGIPVGKVGFIGYGSRIPVAPNDTDEGRATNRRTEIYIE
jgi:predicted outer membrane repeat protein